MGGSLLQVWKNLIVTSYGASRTILLSGKDAFFFPKLMLTWGVGGQEGGSQGCTFDIDWKWLQGEKNLSSGESSEAGVLLVRRQTCTLATK